MKHGQFRTYRIGITTNTLSAGGAEKQRVLLANELAARGHKVSLYCLQGLGALRPQVSDLVKVHRPLLWGGPTVADDFIITGTTNTETAFALIGRLRYARHPTKWIMAIHNPVGPGAPVLKRFSRVGLRLADRLLALDLAHAAAVNAHWNIRVDAFVPNGLDLEWSEQVRSERQRIKKFDFDVGYIGRISKEHKGLDLLFAAMASAEADDLTLGIAGLGPDIEELKDLAKALGISDKITWLGHQEPATFLKRISTLALFSRYEGQPLVLLEAKAGGVPVVASQTSCATASARVLVVNASNANEAARALKIQAQLTDGVHDADSLLHTVADMTSRYIEHMSGMQGLRRRLWRKVSAVRPNEAKVSSAPACRAE